MALKKKKEVQYAHNNKVYWIYLDKWKLDHKVGCGKLLNLGLFLEEPHETTVAWKVLERNN